jgi:Mrp family chromosome partitioning ATPase
MTRLVDLRFVMLSGKGGVGRTTVAAALARVAAGAGKRVLLAEATTADRLGRMFGRQEPLGTRVETVAPGIDVVNITAEIALREYGTLMLHSELVSRALFENRAVRGFLGAIPGLDAYAVLGKVWWHTTELANGRPRYDLVIFDGPASGHAALMLKIPQAIIDAMPKGPLSGDARAISDLLHDAERAAFVIVTLAEELPAREAVELATATRGALGVPLGPLIVNAIPTAELGVEAVTEVLGRAPLDGAPGAPAAALGATLRLAASVRAHRQAADAVLRGLARDPGLPLVTLPRIPTAEVSPAVCAALAESLGVGLARVTSLTQK